MARKKKPEAHVNHERWLVSYADFITLLFAFFTTLYAISTVDSIKMKKLIGSIHSAMGKIGSGGNPLDPGTPSASQPMGTVPGLLPGGSKNPSNKNMAELAQSLAKLSSAFGGDARFQVRIDPRGVVLSLGDVALFGPGDTRLKVSALPALDQVARLLLQNPHPVQIEGHTDDRAGVKPSKNWMLSTERAVTVLSYLVEEHGYPPQRLAASGYGPYHPLADNKTEEGRAQNRRVDLVILKDTSVPPDFR